MSIKLNVVGVVFEHFKTLKNARTGKLSKSDMVTFLIIPICISLSAAVFHFDINSDFRAACINFGAIFSALLMSVLVLVYDQETKLKDECSPNFEDKKLLLGQLYHNICFTIICSLNCVIFSLLHIVFDKSTLNVTYLNSYFITPVIIFSLLSLILTTYMILKRLHALLTIK